MPARRPSPRFALLAGALALAGCDNDKDRTPQPPASATAAMTASSQAPADKAGPGPIPVPGEADVKPRPLFALYTTDPWAMVIGSDVPSVVIYDDGTTITLPKTKPAKPGDGPARVTTQITNPAKVVADLFALLKDQPARQSLSRATDQPVTEFLIRSDAGWILRSVYGMRARCEYSSQHGKPPPAPVASACSALTQLVAADAKAWEPDRIEVMLWGFEHSRKPPKPWPKSVPPPPNRAPPDSGTLHHVIDAKHRPALMDFLKSLEQSQAIEHGGHRWTASVRSVVPGDAFLMKARREIWRQATR